MTEIAKKLACAAAVGALIWSVDAAAQQRVFDIQPLPANKAVLEFARQANVQIVAPGGKIRAVRTRRVKGVLEVMSALETMLRGTGLRVLARSPSTITLGYAPGEAETLTPMGQVTPSVSAPVPEPVDQVEEAPQADILVTGSRIVRSGYSAPTPLSVINSDDIERRAASSIGSALQETPSFRPSQNPTAARTFTNSGYYADLRGLGANRTLVLVDGRRFVPTSSVGTVDLNMVPTMLVDRSEIVTGGASAAWGSDAVAGVVNVILKKKLQGVIGEVQAGISEVGDGFNTKLSLGGGSSFAGGNGHAMLGVEYTTDDGIGDNYTRDWGREEWWFVQNPGFATNGKPATIWTKNVHYSSQTPGGLIATGPLRGTAYAADGTPYQFGFGEVYGDDQIGGDGYGISSWTGVNIRQPIDLLVALGRVSYDIGDTTLFAEGNYAKIHWKVPSVGTRNFGTQAPSTSAFAPIVVRTDNPFIPAATRAALSALPVPIASFQVGRFGTENFQQITTKDNETVRGVIGAEGKIGDFKWDTYAQYGHNIFQRGVVGQRVEANWRRAIDVTTVMQGGVAVPICRDLISPNADVRAAAAGCAPYDIFGTQAASAAARAYVTGLSEQRQKTSQAAFAFNVQTSPFDIWAGPVSVATGVEYRREALRNRSSPLEQARAFSSANTANVDGNFNVKEAYLETLIPLVRDVPLLKAVDLSAAVRLADYSTSGRVTTWKVGATWEVNRELRFRATRSRDVRAPNLTELFTPATSSNARVIDPFLNTAYTVRTYSTGNTSLDVETADTLTAGVVFQPGWAPRLQASVDYYSIDIGGVISTSGAQIVLDSCFAGRTDLCGLISRPTPTGNIVQIDTPFLNLNRFKTSGMDFELSYRLPLADISSLPGNVGLRMLGTYVWDFTLSDSSGSIDRSGQNPTPVTGTTTGVADLLVNTTLTYDTDDFGFSLQARYINGGKINNAAVPGTATSLNINSIPSRTYFNLAGHWTLIENQDTKRKVELFATVDNLLDKDPPFPSFDGIYYDLVGRAYRGGIRFRY